MTQIDHDDRIELDQSRFINKQHLLHYVDWLIKGITLDTFKEMLKMFNKLRNEETAVTAVFLSRYELNGYLNSIEVKANQIETALWHYI